MFICFVLATLCNAEENYISRRSIEDEESIKVDAKDVQILPNSTIDTTLLHTMLGDYDFFFRRDFQKVVQSNSDNASVVFRLDNKKTGEEGEYSICLFGELDNKRVTGLYFNEVGQGESSWRLTETAFVIQCDSTSKRVTLTAILRAVGFPAASLIRGPINDTGWYDYDIDRYMLVKSEFTVDEEMIKFFPKVYKP